MKRRRFLSSLGAGIVGTMAVADEPIANTMLNDVYQPYTSLTGPTKGIPDWINDTPVIGRIEHLEENKVKLVLSANQKITADFVLAKQEYPIGGVLSDRVIEDVTVQEGSSITKKLTLDGDKKPPSDKYCYMLYAYDSANNPVYICESGPLAHVQGEVVRVKSEHRRASTPKDLEFSRSTYNGGYAVSHKFKTNGIKYQLDSWMGKAPYEAAVNRERNVIAMYEEALQNPHAQRVAEMFWQMPGHTRTTGPANTHARATEDTPKRPEALVFKQVVDFVQQIDYEKDYFSEGSFEYPRTIEEVLVDGEGDCEDTTFLLAGILNSEPFGYDTAFLATQYHTQPLLRLKDLPTEELGGYRGLIENPVESWDTFEIEGEQYTPIETTSPTPIGKAENLPVRGIYKDSKWIEGDLSALATSAMKSFTKFVNLKF